MEKICLNEESDICHSILSMVKGISHDWDMLFYALKFLGLHQSLHTLHVLHFIRTILFY